MRLTTWTLSKGWRQWLGFFIFFYACLLALPAMAAISPGTIDFGTGHGSWGDVSSDYNGLRFTGQWVYYTDGDLTGDFGGTRVPGSTGDAITATDTATGNATIKSANGTDRFSLTSVKIFAFGMGMTQFTFAGYRNGSPTGSSDTVNVTSANSSFVNFNLSNMTDVDEVRVSNNSPAEALNFAFDDLAVAPSLSLSPTTLSAATVAAAYNQTITASGGTSPYTYAVTAGALPAGMTLSSAGALSGTPTAGGSFNLTITATDSTGGTPVTGSRAYTLTVNAPTISVSPTSLPYGTLSVAYSQGITASGGTAPYTYAITAGALPAGLSLNSATGALSGTPTASGTFNLAVTATDSSTGAGPYTGSRAYALTITAAPTATTGAASTITATGATLGGTVSSNGASTTVTFEYGLTTGYGSSVTASQSPLAAGASNSSVSAAITGLTCNTTYHFRVKAVNSVGTTNGNDATFTTSACAPTATTGSATSITASGATLDGTVSSGGASTTVTFEYGLTTGYGSSATASQSPLSAGASNSSVSAVLSGLSCNTIYYFRVKAVNGIATTNGLNDSFITTPCAPTVSSLSPASGPLTSGNSVVLTGTNFTGAIAVMFGATPAVGFAVNAPTQITAIAPAGTVGNVNVTVTTVGGTSATGAGNQYSYVALPVVSSLSPTLGTTAGGTSVTLTGTGFTGASAVSFGGTAATGYTVNSPTQITATAPAHAQGSVDVTVTTLGGTSATGASTSFSYAAAPTATTGVASSITAVGATIAGTANDNGDATTLSFEYGLNTSYGSTATATPATLSAGAGSTVVSGSLSGLTCNTTYHFRLNAVNGIATTNGLDASFTTAACPSIATTNAASAISATAATVNATVNDNGAATSVSFDWGTSISYGNSASATPATVAAGAGSTAVSGSLSGLACNTVYHYRVSATSTAGTSQGSDATFTTSACAPGAPTGVTATGGDAQASVSFTAPASNGGAAISGYTVMVSPPDVPPVIGSGSPIVVTGLTNGQAYTFRVTADNSAGSGPASTASNSITPAAIQTITFANPGAQNFGTSPTLSASSDSGLSVSFTSSTTGVCTITTGGLLSFVSTGSCTINADQAGDGSYQAAPQVSRTFTVNAVVPAAPSIGTASASNTQASVSFTAPASNGGATISGYTVTSSPGGFTGTGTASPITVSGLTNGTAYTFTVTATNSVGTGAASAASNSVTPTASQTITFNDPGTQSFGTSPTLSASSDSGLSVSFTSSTTGVCTITSSGVLTFADVGTCTINAAQAGNASYLAATPVSRTFSVNAVVPGAPTIGTATAGNSQATVSFSAPAFSGGAAITGYTLVSIPGGITASGVGSPITISGLTNGTSYSFTVAATNAAGTGGASAASNSVKPNGAPTITSTALTSATQDAAYSYTLVATDSDVGDSLTLSAVTLPNWLNFNGATGVLSGTPGTAQVGSHTIVLRAMDRDGLSAEQRFTLVVTKANAAPTITSTALTSATQDAAYSYTLVATDSDVGDSLTLSAVTLPNWLNFNAATGVLSGTPGTAQVGSHAVVLRATDADGLSVDQSFTIVVANVNDAPVAADQVITVEEDGSVMITPAAEDADHDLLTYEITAQPSAGTLEQHGNVWLYMPKQDFNGTDSFGFIAKDAELSSESATVTITVAPVNDAPQAVDDSYTLTGSANDTYSLAVLANDVDVDGDKLTIVGAATDIGSVQVTSDGLSLSLPEAYVGPVALRYTLSDGHVRATAKVNVLIASEESDNQPVITMPDDVEVNATGLFTRVNLGFAKAVDRNGAPLPVSLVDKNLFFAPGNHSVYWQAVDHDGNKAIKEQKVKVKPLISLSKDQAVSEGNQVTVSVHLNGDAPSYPVSIPYTVSGSADSSDHDLVDGVVEITSGRTAQIHFNTLNDGVAEGNEDVLITLDPSLNLGSKQQIRVMITEVNIAPDVDLKVTQAGLPQLIVAQDGGDVHIRATTSDANVQDNVTLAWESGSLSLQADGAGMFFSPQAVQPGIYPVSLTATDDGTPVMSSTATVYIVVRPSLAVLTSADTDGDLIPDDQEGYGDSDSDGIPDYLDATSDCNVMPEMALQPEHFLAEGQAGVCLRLGSTALQRGQSGMQLPPASVVNDTVAANVGGIFDFIATGLPQAGQSYSLVLPQQLPIPANAVYRKYSSKAGWRNFVIDERNSVASAEGERGFCPSPGDSRWTPGLTEGHWCVQLLIEDGGPNDDDGVANRTIVDPSGVAVTLNGNNLPTANPDSASIGWNQSIDVDVLANDTDSDGDSLAITQVVSEFGTATVLANQQISYKPEPDFIGTDVLVYSITDGKGGTASSELTIVVNGNTAPVTVNDSAATDDRSSLLIDVLSNDTDVDGNALTLVSATAQQGLAAIESNKLRYTPKTGFVGVDTVTYRISDGLGGEATGQVSITVKASHGNKSGGGSINLWALAVILACAVMRRRPLARSRQ